MHSEECFHFSFFLLLCKEGIVQNIVAGHRSIVESDSLKEKCTYIVPKETETRHSECFTFKSSYR